MKAFSKKWLAVAAGLALSSASALAGHVSALNFGAEQFRVNPGAIGETNPLTGVPYAPFFAGSIQFAYRGLVNQATTGAFTEVGSAQFSNFLTNVGGSPIGSLTTTGLNLVGTNGGTPGYHLYATFSGTGTTTPNIGGGIDGVFNTFAVQIFADPNNNTTFNPPGTQGSPSSATTAPGGIMTDDVLVLTGNLNVGGFHVFNGLAGGDFDVRFNVTGFGATDFFSITQDGQRLTQGDFAGNNNLVQGVAPPPNTFVNAEIVGSGDNTFQSIPEPTSLALVGIALVGGALARRKAQA